MSDAGKPDTEAKAAEAARAFLETTATRAEENAAAAQHQADLHAQAAAAWQAVAAVCRAATPPKGDR